MATILPAGTWRRRPVFRLDAVREFGGLATVQRSYRPRALTLNVGHMMLNTPDVTYE